MSTDNKNDTSYLEGLTREEYLEQLDFEERIMDSLFTNVPVDVQMGSKTEIIKFIADKAIELYEGKK